MLAGLPGRGQLIQVNARLARSLCNAGMNRILIATFLAAALAACAQHRPDAAAPPLPPPQSDRGAMLYENHCTICHTSVVHVREDHRATSDVDVENWVRRWSSDQKLGWSDEDVADVTAYLLRTFYNF